MKKICIVTTRHVSYNPRVLKEADTFFAAGYNVVVVTVNNSVQLSRFDDELMRSRRWTLRTVNFRKTGNFERLRWMAFSIKQKLYSALARLTFNFGIAERAGEKAFDALIHLAKREKADLYLVHHAEALGIGAAAARYNGALMGFDAEDLHTAMDGMSPGAAAMISFLEKKYLPACSYFSAASRGIGEAYHKIYGVKEPLTLLNVFPLERIAGIQVEEPVRFYWYSQVIGPHRGLERLIEASGLLDGGFEIHLRGTMQPGYRQEIERLIGEAGLEGKIFFHDPMLARDLIGEASRYHVGLALELNSSQNRMICVTNKVFSYLMSGLALIATDTPGQKDILQAHSDIGILCRMDDAASLAAAMKYYLDDPHRLLKARLAARSAAESSYNWETESEKLLSGAKKLLAKSTT